VIFPVPVTLNLFLALEFVLTFGIFYLLLLYPAGASGQPENFLGLVGETFNGQNFSIVKQSPIKERKGRKKWPTKENLIQPR
jgi:hypothetical protein